MKHSWGIPPSFTSHILKPSQHSDKKKKDGAGGTHKQTLSFGLITDAGNWDTDFDQLTGYSWNPDLFTTGPIPAIRCGLNFNNVVLFNGQQKFSWSFICVQHLHIILTASPIENLKCMNKHIFFFTVCFYFFIKIIPLMLLHLYQLFFYTHYCICCIHRSIIDLRWGISTWQNHQILKIKEVGGLKFFHETFNWLGICKASETRQGPTVLSLNIRPRNQRQNYGFTLSSI